MLRSICLLPLLALAACAGPWEAAWNRAEPAAGKYDFNWRLSGDPAVAPLQVFGTEGQIWLQFAPGQAVPALFASTPQGDVPLRYRRQDPYVVIDGAWRALTMRGGRYAARAVRQGEQGAGLPESFADAAPAPAVRHLPLTEALSMQPAGPASGASTASSASTASGTADASGASATQAALSTPAIFRAGMPDATLRAVLARWAVASDWTFEPQHWAVDVDIPLAGSAEFPGDFKQAVRELLASTELSERPLQPCFYSNRVLRVVPLTQACDRSAVPEGAAS